MVQRLLDYVSPLVAPPAPAVTDAPAGTLWFDLRHFGFRVWGEGSKFDENGNDWGVESEAGLGD